MTNDQFPMANWALIVLAEGIQHGPATVSGERLRSMPLFRLGGMGRRGEATIHKSGNLSGGKRPHHLVERSVANHVATSR